MTTKLKTVSVRLDDEAGARVSKAAQLARQSKGAFLARAGEQAARQMLLDWAVERYASGEASLSELASETKLPLEVIAEDAAKQRSLESIEMYLTSARRLAKALKTPRFYQEAKRAAESARREAAAGSETGSSRR